MAWRNTASGYGRIARWLHWSVALLFLASYAAVKYRHWFTEAKTPENWTALQLHLSVGITIAVLVLLRVLWRASQPQPAPPPGGRWEHRTAHLGHMALYAVMIIAPITGYIGTGVDTEFFWMFDIPKFESTALYQWLVPGLLGLDFETWEAPIDFLHKEILGKWLIWILIAGHAAAALYHQYVRKDGTLTKMTRGAGVDHGTPDAHKGGDHAAS